MYKNIICQNYGCKCQPQVAIEVEKIGRSDDPISEGITVNYVINYARLCHGSKETITQQVKTDNRLAVACFNMAVRRLFSSLALLILVVSMNTYRALSFQDLSGMWNFFFLGLKLWVLQVNRICSRIRTSDWYQNFCAQPNRYSTDFSDMNL